MNAFTDILDTYSVKHQTEGHHSRAGWVNFDCPFCGKHSGKGHMGYNLAFNYVNCWKCGHHTLYETLIAITQENATKVYELYRSLLGPGQAPFVKLHEPKKLELPQGIGFLQECHIRYLKLRQFDPEEIQRLWGVRGIGLAVKMAWRIFIPIHHHGQLVSWTTRAINEAHPRYWSAKPEQELLPAKKLLFGEDYCRHAAIAVEGPLDAWRVGPGAVATLGTAFSKEQALKLSKYPVRVVCFDNEPIAQAAAKKLCEFLAVFPGATHKVTLDSKDPGEASKKEIKQLRKSFL